METLLFYLFATLSVAFGLMMIMARQAIYSAVCLVGVMFCLAGLFALLSAHLIAALQILVYAGAVMVLFIFVIMLLNLREKAGLRSIGDMATQLFVVIVLGALFVPLVASYEAPQATKLAEGFGSTASVGTLLYTDYILPFEIVSVLLLAALVGAVALAKTRMR
ncbi:NADH-ubiquinone oxidoreductase chain J [hydrothermal vent metagenome]|uniref:NADH-ubiquinone oxidoreductase chain J n=1 Tax=hydrothermal vent metagenome TaxID=652676 RepID=A0A3B1CRJ2_9ZZZZ